MAEIDVTRIAGNIGAMNALNSLQNINKQLSVHQTRLATGKRINSAADDPAGLTIATKMQSRSEGLKVALSNIGDAKNLLAVAESGLGRINDILVQMRNKSEAAASDTLGDNERAAVVVQLKAYVAQIDDIAAQTEWNGNKLIDGTYNAAGGQKLTFQTGVGVSDYTQVGGLENMSATGATLALASKDTIVFDNSTGTHLTLSAVTTGPIAPGTYRVNWHVDFTDAHLVKPDSTQETVPLVGNKASFSLFTIDGTGAVGDSEFATITVPAAGGITLRDHGTTGNVLTDAADFRNYMDYIGQKMDVVSQQLSLIGATTGRLGFKEDQVAASQVNVEAAYNRIMNANMAEEQVNASKYQILQQTATAMLAQANAAPQFLLSLFR